MRGAGIRLDQFLKWAGVAPTGGQAKALVVTGCVTVNGRPESRRGRQLRPGDIVGVRRPSGLHHPPAEREGSAEDLFEVVGSGGDGP